MAVILAVVDYYPSIADVVRSDSDTSRRAVQNAPSLVYGLRSPSKIYATRAFTKKLMEAGRFLPQVHLIVKNRVTQYMERAAAYAAVLGEIASDVRALLKSHPQHFSFAQMGDGAVEARDFRTTGGRRIRERLPGVSPASRQTGHRRAPCTGEGRLPRQL